MHIYSYLRKHPKLLFPDFRGFFLVLVNLGLLTILALMVDESFCPTSRCQPSLLVCHCS